MIFLSLLGAHASDPWNRPQKARVVVQPPKNWSQLWSTSKKHRLWWDQSPDRAEIQWLSPKGWKTMTRRAKAGWISSKLPIGSQFRIRFPKQSKRWTPMLSASPWYSPIDIALLNQKPNKIPGTPTSLGHGEHLWVGSLYGGLTEVRNKNIHKIWRRWDGLLDDRILALDHDEELMLIGTMNGATLMMNRRPVRSWQQEFLSPHIQVVSIRGDDLWLGSYRGLYRVRAGHFEKRLLPRSVFSIEPAKDGGVWVGYEGLQYIAKDDSTTSIPDMGNVYSIQDRGEKIWFTSNRHGVAYIQDQTVTPYRKEIANELLFEDQDLWIAADEGLILPSQERISDHSVVYAIERDTKQHWLATKKGLILYEENRTFPMLDAQSSTYYQTIWPTSDGALLFAEQQTYTLGTAVFEPKNWTKTRLGWYPESVNGSWIDLSRYKNRLWRLNEEGIWSGTSRKPLYPIQNIIDIEASSLSVWGQSNDGRIYRFTLGKQEKIPGIYDVQQISAGERSICVGAKDGLYRIWQRKENSVEKIFDKKPFVEAVYSERDGTCWYATRAGQLGRIDTDQQNRIWDMPPHIDPIEKIVLQQEKGVWLLTQKGVWLLRIEP
ncbi:MAG: hypothetical protein VX278_04855 [Myxococcota bacterium]|nr:hypothetical protein [Myxococcota bacterium]